MIAHPWLVMVFAVAAVSSALFVDRRHWMPRLFGFALLFGGCAMCLVVAFACLSADGERAAKCRSLGGAPANGHCYVNGVAK